VPDFIASARAGSDGTATVTVQQNLAGLVWVVSQISVTSEPLRAAANCTVRRNGQLMTTTSIVPATAGGQPFYRLNSGDTLTFEFTNLTANDIARATVSYSESQWGEYNDGSVI
jgi:hypothetical protein